MGKYARTFYKIFIHDISKFAMILTVFLLAFAGSVYIALAASQAFNDDFRWADCFSELTGFYMMRTLTLNGLHYIRSVCIPNFSGPYFPVLGLNTEIYWENLHI